MIELSSFESCAECRVGFEEHSCLKPIGEPVCLPGTIRITYQFFQCLRCGHVWQKREERGFGANGRFEKMLTGSW